MERQILSSEELSEVLRRAQEIDTHGGSADLDDYVKAAEEAGISRDATMQALRERLGYPVAAAQTGEFVFARSADGHYYPAKVESTEDRTAKVKFLNGAQVQVPLSDLRELNLTPGQKVNYLSPSMKMWSNGTVRAFNRDALSLEVDNWGSSETVTLDKVRMLQQNIGQRAKDTVNLWAIKLSWLAGGVGLGFLLERLLTR